MRTLCSKMLHCKVVNVFFHLAWIKAEASCSPVEAAACRSLCQKAMLIYESNADIWRAYLAFEQSQKNFAAVAKLKSEADRRSSPQL